MIHLYGFGKAFGLPDPSPFVMKVASYLSFRELEFSLKSDFQNLQKSPKGKLPFIEKNGEIYADSAFIISHLENEAPLALDHWLSEDQKALAYLLSKSIDESLYWCLVYSRWIDEANWQRTKNELFSEMPFPLKLIIPGVARAKVKSSLKKQGYGRHSHNELKEIAVRSIQSLSTILCKKPYFLGDQPSTLDASAFGMLCGSTLGNMKTEFGELIREHQNLVDYCEHIRLRHLSSLFS